MMDTTTGVWTASLIVRWLHLLAAILWLGGMTFATFALMPALRGTVDPASNAMLMGRVVRRFRLMVGTSIVLLVGTGIFNALVRVPSLDLLFGSIFGAVLLVKIALVAGMVTIFLLAPRLTAYAHYYSCDPAQTRNLMPMAAGSAQSAAQDHQPAPIRQRLSIFLHVLAIGLGAAVVLLAKILGFLPAVPVS